MANRVTRRQFMTRTGLALGGVALGPQLLAACGGDDSAGSGNGDGGGGGDQIWFENWPEYIDAPDDDLYGAGGTLATFQDETGRTIRYTQAFNDNNEYFAKIQPLLSNGDPIGPNIIAPTNWMAGRLIQLGWVEKLPLDDIPNSSNLAEQFRNPPTDPTGEYSLPWQAGIAGVAFNLEATGRPLTSVQDMWAPDLAGKVVVLTEMRDTIGLIAMSEGIDITDPTVESLQPAFDTLQEQVDSGQIRQFTGKPVVGKLVGSGIELKVRPVVVTRWKNWREAHPDTKVLSLDTGHRRDYTPGKPYGNYFNQPAMMFPANVTDWRLQPKDYVFAVRLPEGRKAWPIKAFAGGKVANDEVGGVGVVLIGDAVSETVRAYRREGRRFAAGATSTELVSDGGKWTLTEDALVGPAGEKLARLPGHNAFWFAWQNYYSGEAILGTP